MLINLSNHPFEKEWDEMHKKAALKEYGSVKDLPFPDVDPNATTDSVVRLATEYIAMCTDLTSKSTDMVNAVHISGEPCFLFQFVTLAKARGIQCVCSTTHRMVSTEENIKTSIFQFVQFRKY